MVHVQTYRKGGHEAQELKCALVNGSGRITALLKQACIFELFPGESHTQTIDRLSLRASTKSHRLITQGSGGVGIPRTKVGINV